MKSPCIKKCVLKDNICTGCSRTIQEITNWTKYTDEEKLKVFERLKSLKETCHLPKKI